MATQKEGTSHQKTLIRFAEAALIPWLVFVGAAFAQLNEDQLSDIKNQAAGTGVLKFERVTTVGRFLGCQLEFSVALRDWRAKKGELVKYTGSLSSFYERGKAFGVMVKVKGQDLILHPNGRVATKDFDPSEVALMIGSHTYTTNQAITAFRCEDGGRCTAFASSDTSFLEHFLAALTEDDIGVSIASSKGGMDLSFKVARIRPANETYPEYLKFVSCYTEFLNHMASQD